MQNWKTEKLYDTDAYATEFQATVCACEAVETVDSSGEKVTLYAVRLNRTLFFPEEGGQTPDKGTLGNAQVVDVQIKNEEIIHFVTAPLKEGALLTGNIDWKHRFSNMQQHSGEHIFSGLAYQRYGLSNVGFHLSNQIVTMDFDGVLSLEQLEELEWAVNQAIAENVEVKTGYPSKEELETLEYRSKIAIEGAIRIVEVVGYDICACCAPHVRRTGEIGSFKILGVQNYKGGIRIRFVCGFRALEEYRKKAEIITSLSGILSTNQENLAEYVEKLKAQVQSLKTELSITRQQLLEQEIASKQGDVFLFEEKVDNIAARNVINRWTQSHTGVCGIFIGNDTEGYHFIMGSRSMDCRKVFEILHTEVHARGGGKAPMVQGSVQAKKEEILLCFKNIG